MNAQFQNEIKLKFKINRIIKELTRFISGVYISTYNLEPNQI